MKTSGASLMDVVFRKNGSTSLMSILDVAPRRRARGT